jgi:RimJ/RimL family protein N-acetyltransferase
LLLIIEHGTEPCGVVRLDPPNASGRREVSIYLGSAHHRLGIGTAALAQLRYLVPEAALEATVLAGNDASANLFIAAGYRLLADGVYVDTPDRECA